MPPLEPPSARREEPEENRWWENFGQPVTPAQPSMQDRARDIRNMPLRNNSDLSEILRAQRDLVYDVTTAEGRALAEQQAALDELAATGSARGLISPSLRQRQAGELASQQGRQRRADQRFGPIDLSGFTDADYLGAARGLPAWVDEIGGALARWADQNIDVSSPSLERRYARPAPQFTPDNAQHIRDTGMPVTNVDEIVVEGTPTAGQRLRGMTAGVREGFDSAREAVAPVIAPYVEAGPGGVGIDIPRMAQDLWRHPARRSEQEAQLRDRLRAEANYLRDQGNVEQAQTVAEMADRASLEALLPFALDYPAILTAPEFAFPGTMARVGAGIRGATGSARAGIADRLGSIGVAQWTPEELAAMRRLQMGPMEGEILPPAWRQLAGPPNPRPLFLDESGSPLTLSAEEIAALRALRSRGSSSAPPSGGGAGERLPFDQGAGAAASAPAQTAPQRRVMAAIRDPETGQVYYGTDHFEAIDAAPAVVQSRLQGLYNAPEDPAHVGFAIDGEFLPRAEALDTMRARLRGGQVNSGIPIGGGEGGRPLMDEARDWLRMMVSGSSRNERLYDIGRYLDSRRRGGVLPSGQARTGEYGGVYGAGRNADDVTAAAGAEQAPRAAAAFGETPFYRGSAHDVDPGLGPNRAAFFTPSREFAGEFPRAVPPEQRRIGEYRLTESTIADMRDPQVQQRVLAQLADDPDAAQHLQRRIAQMKDKATGHVDWVISADPAIRDAIERAGFSGVWLDEGAGQASVAVFNRNSIRPASELPDGGALDATPFKRGGGGIGYDAFQFMRGNPRSVFPDQGINVDGVPSTVETVPAGSLTPTQPRVSDNFLDPNRPVGGDVYGRPSPFSDMPAVYRNGEDLFVLDGHNRIAASVARGEPNIRVRVFDARDGARPNALESSGYERVTMWENLDDGVGAIRVARQHGMDARAAMDLVARARRGERLPDRQRQIIRDMIAADRADARNTPDDLAMFLRGNSTTPHLPTAGTRAAAGEVPATQFYRVDEAAYTPDMRRDVAQMRERGAFREEEVPLGSLVGTQPNVRANYAAAARSNEPIEVLRINSVNYITDGHHRAAARIGAGDQGNVRVRVFEPQAPSSSGEGFSLFAGVNPSRNVGTERARQARSRGARSILQEIELAASEGRLIDNAELSRLTGLSDKSVRTLRSALRSDQATPAVRARIQAAEDELGDLAALTTPESVQRLQQLQAEGLTLSQTVERMGEGWNYPRVRQTAKRHGIRFPDERLGSAYEVRNATWLADNDAGMSFRQIAARDGVGVGTVASGIRTAKAARETGALPAVADPYEAIALRLGITPERARALSARARRTEAGVDPSRINNRVNPELSASNGGTGSVQADAPSNGSATDLLPWLAAGGYLTGLNLVAQQGEESIDAAKRYGSSQ